MRIIIIGGGAAGFMAAITAAEHGPPADIIILEKNRTVLNKVRISGGGRCNVTHACFDIRQFVKNYPRGENFLKKLLAQFDARATVAWFEEKGVGIKTEKDGRMFPITDSSDTVINCLLDQVNAHGIKIRTGMGVSSISPVAGSGSGGGSSFLLRLQNGESLLADRVLVATGGHPQYRGFDWLAEHGHLIQQPYPSLFTFNAPGSYLLSLSGVSVQDTVVKIAGTAFSWRGPLLLTHWGFSGPAILKLSAWGARVLGEMNYAFTCRINWLPALKENEIRAYLLEQKTVSARQLIFSRSHFNLPIRLWRALLSKIEIHETLRWSDTGHKPLNRLVELLTNSQFEIRGKSTYKEEFVTAGGVALSEIDPLTLESTRVPGLYFAGEVLDVDGITGGFNFQNAWTTGYIAGKMISRKNK